MWLMTPTKTRPHKPMLADPCEELGQPVALRLVGKLADGGDVAVAQILKLLSGMHIAWATKKAWCPSSTGLSLSSSEAKAFHSSAGSPRLLSLNAHIRRVLTSHPASCVAQFRFVFSGLLCQIAILSS